MAFRHSFARAVSPFWDRVQDISSRAREASYERVKVEHDHELDGSPDGALLSQQHRPSRSRPRPLLSQSGRRVALVALGVLALLLFTANRSLPSRHALESGSVRADHKLYLLVPTTDELDLGFCRTQLTAAVLGYPTPQMLDRKVSGRSEKELAGDKIRLTNDHLNEMGGDRDDDMVLLLDSAHHWFQLTPEVLMKRYYDIIRRADARAKKQSGEMAAPSHRIVFAAQNHCSGHTLDEVACFAPPNNPHDKASTLRFLDTGVAVGPIKDMRRLFNRINGQMIARHGEEMDQQTVLADFFGEQAFRRELIRQRSKSSGKRKLESVLRTLGWSKPSITDSFPGRRLPQDPEKEDYEMGITLDYGNELGLSISRPADLETLDWVYYNHSATLPKDIEHSRPPFWTTTSSWGLPTDRSWADIPLLTSTRTGSIPAIIHIAEHQQVGKEVGLDWSSLWLHPYARTLWKAQNEIPRLPLMSVVDDKIEHIFWNQEIRVDRDGANWMDNEWKSWSDQCGWSALGELVFLGA